MKFDNLVKTNDVSSCYLNKTKPSLILTVLPLTDPKSKISH